MYIDCTPKTFYMNTKNNHEISLQTAIELTKRYRANRPSNFPVCETFEKEAVLKLLNTEACASLRIYFGMKENEEVVVVLAAADASGADILPAANSTASAAEDGVILEDGYRCPTLCPPGSPLNED
jgi:hypothetical protein